MKAFNIKSSSSIYYALLFLYGLIDKKDKIRIFLLILGSIAVGILEIILVYSISPILNAISSEDLNYTFLGDFLLQYNQENILIFGSIFFISLILVTLISKIKVLAYGNFLAADIGQILGKKLIKNYLSQLYENHIRRESAEIINTFNYHLNRTVKLISCFLELVVASISVILLMMIIILTNPFITISTFIVLGSAYLYVGKICSPRMTKDTLTVNNSIDKLTQIIQNLFNEIENVILNYEDLKKIKNFNEEEKRLRFSESRIKNYGLLPRYIIEAIALSSLTLSTLIYALLTNTLNISILETIGTILFGLQRLLPSINLGYRSWSNMKVCAPCTQYLEKLISSNIESNRIENGFKTFIRFKNKIELNNISHSYNKSTNFNIFENERITIYKGDKYLITGPSGSGKTSMINILSTLIKPSKGSIFVDGCKLDTETSIALWRRQISYVKQKPYLPSKTILNTILVDNFNENNVNYAIRKAKSYAEIACIDKVINNLPNKYLHKITEGGLTLSGGQLQRIIIARALAKRPSLLILDEATTGIDKKTESKIFENLLKLKNLTLIVISHSKNVEKLFEKKLDLTKSNNPNL